MWLSLPLGDKKIDLQVTFSCSRDIMLFYMGVSPWRIKYITITGSSGVLKCVPRRFSGYNNEEQ